MNSSLQLKHKRRGDRCETAIRRALSGLAIEAAPVKRGVAQHQGGWEERDINAAVRPKTIVSALERFVRGTAVCLTGDLMEGGSPGTEKGLVRLVVYSSSLMSEVRTRAPRSAVNASGGKTGRLKVWRGTWAACAWEGGTGCVDARASAFEERYCEDAIFPTCYAERVQEIRQ